MVERADRSSAAGVRWDLSRLFASTEAARAGLAEATRRAETLLARVADTARLDLDGLRLLLNDTSELTALRDLLDEQWGYAGMRLLADASDLEARDLAAESETTLSVVRDAVRAVQLAVGELRLPEGDELEPYAHWLAHQSALAEHRLSVEAEQAFAARAPGAATAWGRLSQEILTSASVPFDPGTGIEPHGVVELRLLRYHADRDVRLRAAEALTGIYEGNAQVAAACLDAVVADRLAEDRLRGRADPMDATLAVDEVDRETVDILLAAIEARTDLVERWYERKRRALGLERLEPHDRFAPVGEAPTVDWPAAVDACCGVFASLSPSLEAVARGVFEDGRVDAERRPRKNGAILCAPFPTGEAFVFLSYLDSATGATHLGHELGHAVHFERASAAGLPWMCQVEPASAAFFEVPSTLAELLVAEHLYTSLGGEGGRSGLCTALEGALTLVFETVAATRFEQEVCVRRAAGQAVTAQRMDELWREKAGAVYGRLVDPYGVMHFPHVFVARFYGYQYAYATLAALALLELRREDPERFGADYVAMLDASGTGTPAELLARCGLDVGDPEVWDRGLGELDRLCALAW